MSRSTQWEDGRRVGVKWAVTRIHAYGRLMNDPWAKALCDCIADDLGCEGRLDERGLKLIKLRDEHVAKRDAAVLRVPT